MSKTAGGQTTVYVYDAWGNLAAEYPTTGTEASSCGTPTCYAVEDHLGSTRMLTDNSGSSTVVRYDYLPFGQEILAGYGNRTVAQGYLATADILNPKFTGQQRDSDTGLDWYQVRHMSGAQGRFQSVDPGNGGANAGDPQTWNGYAYVGNNPLTFTDPSGMFTCASCVGASIGGPVGAAVGGIVDFAIALWAIFGGGGSAALPPPITVIPSDPALGSAGSDFADCKYTLKGCPAPPPSPLGSTIGFFFNWATGTGPFLRYYGPADYRTRDLMKSKGFQQNIRNITAACSAGAVEGPVGLATKQGGLNLPHDIANSVGAKSTGTVGVHGVQLGIISRLELRMTREHTRSSITLFQTALFQWDRCVRFTRPFDITAPNPCAAK